MKIYNAYATQTSPLLPANSAVAGINGVPVLFRLAQFVSQ